MNKFVSGLISTVVAVVIGVTMVYFLHDYVFLSGLTIVTFIAILSTYVVPLILGGIIYAWLEEKSNKNPENHSIDDCNGWDLQDFDDFYSD